MVYQVRFTPDAVLDLRYEGRPREAVVRRAVLRFLAGEPKTESTRRREMDPNPLGATWELRLGDIRVYYDVDDVEQLVRVLRVGYKDRSRVFVRGIETDLREQP